MLDAVLEASRVYSRVRDREVDAMTLVLTTRSHAWSILSGISMAEISVMAVISLPLHLPELRRFRQLSSLHRPIGSAIGFDAIDVFVASTALALDIERSVARIQLIAKTTHDSSDSDDSDLSDSLVSRISRLNINGKQTSRAL